MKNKPLNKHDLVAVLRSFSPKELKRFSLYLASEYFTTRRSLQTLFESLIQFHPLYTDVECSKESLYNQVYPGLSYNGGTMRDLLSELFEAAVDFLTMEALVKEKRIKLAKVTQLRERGLAKQAFKYLGEKSVEEECAKLADSEYFIRNYELLIQKINLNEIFRRQTRQKSISRLFDDIKNSGLSLILYSILETTANYSNLLLMQSRFQETESENFMIDIVNKYHKSGLYDLVLKDPQTGFIVEVYISMLDALIKKGNVDKYRKYKLKIALYSFKLSKDELSMHFSKLINCCIRGSRNGKNKPYFDNELTCLYSEILEKGIYRNNKTKYIPSNLFRAIVLHAVKMNNLAWLKKVIGKFANDLQPADIDNMRNFAMAFYFYASGRSGDALETIGKLNITQFIFKYDIYNLKLRIFYENKEYDAALELIHSYRQFLRSDKLMPASRKVFHRNFMKYVSRLVAIAEGSKKFEAGLEIQKLEKEDCAYKEWLTEKFGSFTRIRRKYSIAG